MRLERPLFPRRAQDSGSHFHLVVSNNIDIEMLSLVYRIKYKGKAAFRSDTLTREIS